MSNRNNPPKLKQVAPQFEKRLINVGGKLRMTYLRDDNSLPIRSTKNERDGWWLHPTKGWRRVSVTRSRGHIGHQKIMRFVESVLR